MDVWRKNYLLPAIADSKRIALVGIGDNEAYWHKSDLNELAKIWDPARLAISNCEYTVYDIDPDLVDRAKKIGINALECDVTLDPPGQGYDYVFASDVIEHVDNPLSFLKNLSLAASIDGRVILTTPNALYWKNCLWPFYTEHPEHNFSFSLKHFENLAKKACLKLETGGSFQSQPQDNDNPGLLSPLHYLSAKAQRANSIYGCFTHLDN